VHASTASRTLDLPWLAGMTAVALIALASRWTLTRVEGSLLIALYFAFVALRLSIFR
jgi:Ca2+/Na+ antiporter